MVRLVGTSPAFSEISELDVDAATFKRAMENAAKTEALLRDKMTGQNGQTSTINHQAVGRGCVLGFPVYSQMFSRKLVDGPEAWDTDFAKDAGYGGIMVVFTPIVISPNDEKFIAVVDVSGSIAHQIITFTAEIVDSGGAVIATQQMTTRQPYDGVIEKVCMLDATGFDGMHFFRIYAQIDRNQEDSDSSRYFEAYYFNSAYLRPFRPSPSNATFSRNLGVDDIRVETPSATQAFVAQDFDTVQIGTQYPIDGWFLSRLNQNWNSDYEYATGWPAGNDALKILTDHDGSGVFDDTAPARRRHLGSSRVFFANEGLPIIPIASWSLGGIKDAGYWVCNVANPPTLGATGWHAPAPTSSPCKFFSQPVMLPDCFATSKLKVIVLIAGRTGTPTNWTFVATATGPTGTVQTSAPTSLTSGPFSGFYYAEITMPSFERDLESIIEVTATRSGSYSAVSSEMAFVGVCVFYDG